MISGFCNYEDDNISYPAIIPDALSEFYLEILCRHVFSYASQVCVPNFKKIMVSIEDSLHLSENFGVQASEPGLLVVEFIFYIVWQLLDATLDDKRVLELTPEKRFRWPIRAGDMDIDEEVYCQRNGYGEELQRLNSAKAVESILQFLQHREISKLLFLACENMPKHWGSFSQRLHLLFVDSSTLQTSSRLRETLQQLLLDGFGKSCESGKHAEFCAVIAPGCMAYSSGHCHGTTRSSLRIPIDLYLEDCIDGSVAATNAIDILRGKGQSPGKSDIEEDDIKQRLFTLSPQCQGYQKLVDDNFFLSYNIDIHTAKIKEIDGWVFEPSCHKYNKKFLQEKVRKLIQKLLIRHGFNTYVVPALIPEEASKGTR